MSTPRVTVLMPVYNGEKYLNEAMDSILSQTFADFEFLILNDGSTDNSVATIQSYGDPRIRLVHNVANLGLIATLNRGIEMARGEYVARMDCDDISLPGRLAKQVAFMDRHQDMGVCGTWYVCFGAETPHISRLPAAADEIRISLLFNSMIAHPTACIRRSFFVSNNLLYDHDYQHAEDYDLWSRALEHCNLANIPEVLLSYRIHAAQVTQKHTAIMQNSANRVRSRLLKKLGIIPLAEELDIHQFFGSPDTFPVADSNLTDISSLLVAADKWLCKLNAGNSLSRTYPEPLFTRMLLWRWMILWHLVFIHYGSSALPLLRGVAIRRMAKCGWFGLVPLIYKKGMSLLDEIRHQKRMMHVSP